MLVAMTLAMELVATAQAQTVPKSLEQGGADAAIKFRKNNWTVGVAGGQLTGTYMTFVDELAQGKKVSFGPAGAASSLTGK
jgi:hypothetical protein